VLRFFDRANALTLVGLSAAVIGIVLSARGRVPWAVVALITSGFCDALDGRLARGLSRTDEQKRFGAHLDTVVDACAFGIAPTALLHAVGLTTLPELAILVVFACCAAWRLAYFDTVGLSDEGGKRSFTGLPTTFASIGLPLALLAGLWGKDALRVGGIVGGLGLAAAMVSPFKVPKPGGKATAIIGAIAFALGVVYATQAHRFGG
jgi:CDP-diacylglycerol---serine O-phosphatidyltransferase